MPPYLNISNLHMFLRSLTMPNNKKKQVNKGLQQELADVERTPDQSNTRQ